MYPFLEGRIIIEFTPFLRFPAAATRLGEGCVPIQLHSALDTSSFLLVSVFQIRG